MELGDLFFYFGDGCQDRLGPLGDWFFVFDVGYPARFRQGRKFAGGIHGDSLSEFQLHGSLGRHFARNSGAFVMLACDRLHFWYGVWEIPHYRLPFLLRWVYDVSHENNGHFPLDHF